MPSEHQLHRLSFSQKVRYFSKYCFLVLICCFSIIIIPGIYLMAILKDKAYEDEEQSEYTNRFQGINSKEQLPWYFSGGKLYPKLTNDQIPEVWPDADGITSDRIKAQLMLMPNENLNITKTIVYFNQYAVFRSKVGLKLFENCPVKSCSISTNHEDAATADALLFTDEQLVLPSLRTPRPPRQIWIMYFTTNPYHTNKLEHFAGLINWTASYRTDTDIVVPYSKWMYYNESIKELIMSSKNFTYRKTKKVVWFVRDCRIDNNGRQKYVEEMGKHIQIDIFGNCKDHSCPCFLPEDCIRLLDQYKFYIAFEAYNCRDYITEKLFVTIQHSVLPLVMGAKSEDYKKTVPFHSYIDVEDFSSPRELVDYLNKLDRDDALYNEYFRWKSTGEMIDPRFDCRLCALLHSNYPNKTYPDVELWWKNKSCTQSSWKHSKRDHTTVLHKLTTHIN